MRTTHVLRGDNQEQAFEFVLKQPKVQFEITQLNKGTREGEEISISYLIQITRRVFDSVAATIIACS